MSFHSNLILCLKTVSDIIRTSKGSCIIITSNKNFDDSWHFVEQTKQAQMVAPHNFGQAYR